MEAGKAVPQRAPGWSRTLSLINPLRAVWWLFTSVRFAVLLLALLVLLSLAGVVVPQVPSNVRGDAMAEAQWLDRQHERFGFATDAIDAAGLFDVFHQRWFALLLTVTVVSTGSYIVSRFPGVWRTITRPRRRVPDRYFDLAPHRVRAEGAVDPEALSAVLRARRYKVYTEASGTDSYLFADRFQWAQLGTFLTHASVIVFILSAVVSRMDAYSAPLFLSEGATLPVFPVKNPGQMQVQLINAHAEFADDGQPLNYRADLAIFQDGAEVLRCSSTVNSPCAYRGFHFYQAAYFGYGATLVVREAATGNVVYRETAALAEKTPSPHIRIIGSDGVVLLDDTVLLTESAGAQDREYRAGLLRLPDGTPLTFWLPVEGGDLVVFEPSSGKDAIRTSLAPGGRYTAGDLSLEFVRLEDVPSAVVPEFPLPEAAGGGLGDALFLMTNVVYGTDRTSGGDVSAAAPPGEPRLTLVGLQPQSITLAPGESIEVDGLEYGFEGQREFVGIEAKRDRSDNLVWIGAAAIVVGLMITFWVPRRRLWARITGAQLSLAGQAPGHANYTRELADIAVAAGARVKDDGDND